MKTIITVSLAIGLLCGVIAPFVGELHVYRVTSGYSGKQFWISFSNTPTEDAILDAVIFHEPLITDKYETTQAWRKAQKDGTRLYIKLDSANSIVVAPYDAAKDPDVVFLDDTKDDPLRIDPPGSRQKLTKTGGGRIKGIWLTEPAKRTKLPVALVGFAYCIGTFITLAVASLCTLALVRWLWYFLLRRVSELSGAMKNNKSGRH